MDAFGPKPGPFGKAVGKNTKIILTLVSIHIQCTWFCQCHVEAFMGDMICFSCIRDVSFQAIAWIPAFMKSNFPHFLFIFSLFWRLLAQIHTLFQAFSFRSAYIPVVWMGLVLNQDHLEKQFLITLSSYSSFGHEFVIDLKSIIFYYFQRGFGPQRTDLKVSMKWEVMTE